MPPKSNYNLIYEFAVATAIVFGTLFCAFPSEGLFFKWWEEHTFLIMLAFLATGLLFFIVNSKRLMLVSFTACAGLCLLLNDRTQTPLKNAEQTSDALIRIAQFSLNERGDYAMTTELMAMFNTQADLISVQEIPTDSLDAVNNFFACCGYPFFQCVTDTVSELSMVIYSRYSFEFVRDLHFPEAPGVIGKIELPVEGASPSQFYFFNSYFRPSYDEEAYNKTRKNLQFFAQELRRINSPLLVFGDYHIVSWSKDLQDFRETSRLQDSRRGITPTSPHGYISFWDYPFDHIFYSNHFKCISFETISSASTTHLGIVGTYQFKNKDQGKDVKQTSQEL